MMRLSFTKTLLSLALLAQTSIAQDQNFHIYLAIGQSNMEGQGTAESTDQTGYDANRFKVMGTVTCSGSRSYTKGVWTSAGTPIFRCDTKVSLVENFGKVYLSKMPSNIKVGIVPVAIAGCDIKLFDKVNYQSYVSSAASWMKNIINQYGGNPYGRLVEVAKLAQKDGVIKGILFHQGETNSGQSDWPTKVKGVYDNLIKDLGLDATKTPLLVGEMLYSPGQCAGHNSIIAKVPSTIPNSYVISASSCGGQSDNLHFTSAGYRLLGQRYAEKMAALTPVTGIDDANLNTSTDLLSTFPNPSNGLLHVKLNTSVGENTELQVLNAAGHVIYNKTMKESDIDLDLTNFNKGLYMIKVVSQNKEITIKHVIE